MEDYVTKGSLQLEFSQHNLTLKLIYSFYKIECEMKTYFKSVVNKDINLTV